MALEDRIKALTPEQRARAKQCKSAEELLALAKEEGYELTDDELEGISGGSWCFDDCGRHNPLDS